MKFNELKLDVILDIFHRYVATTQHGPFILLTVCNAWRDFVATSPRLWTYIYVDVSQDWEEVFRVYATLSKDLPIEVTLKVPCSSATFLKPYVHRIRFLRLHIVGSFQQEETIDTLCQLHDADNPFKGKVEWYSGHSGDVHITPVDHSQFKRSDYYRIWRTDILKSCQGPRGVFFNEFAPEKFIQYCDSELVWRALLSMTNLAKLRLRSRAFSSLKLVPDYDLHLPQLREMELLFERHADRGTIFQAIINRIQAPCIQTISTTCGQSVDFEDMVQFLHGGICPSSLHLTISGIKLDQPAWNSQPETLNRLKDLTITIHSSTLTDSAYKFILTFLRRFPELELCNLSLDEESYSIISHLESARICPIIITYCGEKEPSGVVNLPMEAGITIEHLTLNADLSKESQLIRNSRALKFASTIGHHVLASPEHWNPDLMALQSDGCYFTANVFDYPEKVVQNTEPFLYLTTIDCPSSVVTFLLQLRLVPSLKTLVISVLYEHDDDSEEFQSLTECFNDPLGEVVCPHLSMLALKFFPPWRLLTNLFSTLNLQGCNPKLQLPALPHPTILDFLTTALSGRAQADATIHPKRFTYKRYCRLGRQMVPHCYYCYNSGWRCFSRQLSNEEKDDIYLRRAELFCRRHSLENLVTIPPYII